MKSRLPGFIAFVPPFSGSARVRHPRCPVPTGDVQVRRVSVNDTVSLVELQNVRSQSVCYTDKSSQGAARRVPEKNGEDHVRQTERT